MMWKKIDSLLLRTLKYRVCVEFIIRYVLFDFVSTTCRLSKSTEPENSHSEPCLRHRLLTRFLRLARVRH